jgi:hypothetical protein
METSRYFWNAIWIAPIFHPAAAARKAGRLIAGMVAIS